MGDRKVCKSEKMYKIRSRSRWGCANLSGLFDSDVRAYGQESAHRYSLLKESPDPVAGPCEKKSPSLSKCFIINLTPVPVDCHFWQRAGGKGKVMGGGHTEWWLGDWWLVLRLVNVCSARKIKCY